LAGYGMGRIGLFWHGAALMASRYVSIKYTKSIFAPSLTPMQFNMYLLLRHYISLSIYLRIFLQIYLSAFVGYYLERIAFQPPVK
jgi:hypothetical protein